MIYESNMNTWAYLIAIAALSLLSAFMLYARFASRSREKSLHHAPQDADLVSATLVDVPVEEIVSEDYGLESSPVVDFKPVSPLESQPEELAELEHAEEEDEKYLDELQEAAAGLAMLMRSSPAQNKTDPVVFAPEASEEMEEPAEAQPESSVAAEQEHESESDLTPMGEAIEQVEAILDGPPVFENESSELESAPAVEGEKDLRGILGEEVVDRFDHLDDSLDDLETLVKEMEGELVLFDEFLSAPMDDEISAAA